MDRKKRGNAGAIWVSIALITRGALLASCSRPLPEPTSDHARLYVRECGMCHPPYHPGLLTAAMWEIQVGRMREIRRQRGQPPLGATDEQAILEYLTKHAG